jgi:hypothetical protein
MMEDPGAVTNGALQNGRLEVLVPVAPDETSRTDMADRSRTLEGKRVGLFWNRKPNGDVFLLRVGELLKERFKNITVEVLQGKGDPAQAAPDCAIAEALQKSDAVIMATGD